LAINSGSSYGPLTLGCSRKKSTPTSLTDGILEILVGGGVKDAGNPGGRVGVELEKVFCRGHSDR